MKISEIRRLRQIKGWSQQHLADLAGTSQPQIKRLEAGERKLSIEWAERLAPHLGVSAKDLMFPDGKDQADTPQQRIRQFLDEEGITDIDPDEIKDPDIMARIVEHLRENKER